MNVQWFARTLCRITAVAVALLLIGSLPALAQVSENAPEDDFENALYGYDSVTGALALLQDVGYVYCSDADGTPILAFQPAYESQAMSDLGAADNGDGTWTIADDGVVVKPQRAAALYQSSESAISTPAEGFGAGEAGAALPVLAGNRVVLVQAQWLNCRRWRPYHLCRGCYHCPQGCYRTRWGSACSVGYTGTKKFKLCRYTGNPWDWCLEYTHYRCTATGYPCNNCTGNPLWSVSWIGWSCWINGC